MSSSEVGKTSVSIEKKQRGCGFSHLYHGAFRCHSIVPRRSSSSSTPPLETNGIVEVQKRKKVRFSETLLLAAVDEEAGSACSNLNSINQKSNLRKTSSLPGRTTKNMVPSGNVGNVVVNGKSSFRSLSDGTNPAIMSITVMGNIVKKSASGGVPVAPVPCRTLPMKSDPEELKEMGNKEYRRGRFDEALALYDRAIAIDRERASYWSNKAAALTRMGRLLDAVEQCKEAVRLEPSYYKAQHRLAALYLRLGVLVKALHHYQLSGSQSTSRDFARVQALRSHFAKFSEARKRKGWSTVLRETGSAIAGGANSAPQVFSSQAEALLKLQRHHEAEIVLRGAPLFDLVASTLFFGSPSSAYILAVRAQVDMASGRFDDAVSVAEKAIELEPSSKEIASVVRRVRAVVLCRSKGNEYFIDSKFLEACSSYQEGLDHEPHNSVLLCNRAACRLKLGQYEEAVKDCNMALRLQPSYKKARLRRADCNTKMGRWEAAVRDYRTLFGETPDNEEVRRALLNARVHLVEEQRM